MGAFLHSLHVRSSDQAGVQRVLEDAGRGPRQRSWLAPAVNGWTTVFPDDLTAVITLGPLLSERCAADVLLTMVHDSDVFLYVLFRAGQKVEEYGSDPDYFGATDAPASRTVPRLVLELLPRRSDAPAVVGLLATEPPTFAEDQFAQFLRLFGIEYGLSTYDDVTSGERSRIARWREFVHVPDLTAEKAARKAAQEKLRTFKKELVRDGRLVFDSELVRKSSGYHENFRLIDALPSEGGFLAMNFGEWRGLNRWDPPADPVGLGNSARLHPFNFGPVLSEAGLLMSRDQELGIVDLQTGAFTACCAPGGGQPMAYDAASGVAWLATRDTLFAVRLRDGEKLFDRPFSRGAQAMRLHPRLPHLVWCSQRMLGVLDKNTGESLFEAELYNPLIAEKKAAQWRAVGSPQTHRDVLEREDFLAVQLDPAGEWLIAGTSEGLRLYSYAELLAHSDAMPAPTMAVETSRKLQDYRYARNLIVDAPRHHVIYTCDDAIRCFDWTTRVDRELRPSFEAKRIHNNSLTLSADGRLLAAFLGYRGEDLLKHQDEHWCQVWDYPALLEPGRTWPQP